MTKWQIASFKILMHFSGFKIIFGLNIQVEVSRFFIYQ